MRNGTAAGATASTMLAITLLLSGCGSSDPTNAERPETTVTPQVQGTVAPAATPTPLVTPTPTSGYTVQSGDTLGAIAQRFGVTLEQLVAANGIEDPDDISIGLELVIPVAGAATPTTPTG